jgi:hypothetical protein
MLQAGLRMTAGNEPGPLPFGSEMPTWKAIDRERMQMAKSAKPKSGDKRKSKKPESRALVTTSPGRSDGSKRKAGIKDLSSLIEHPLVTELLAVGAMAAVSAIAEHGVKSRNGELKKGSRAVKDAGKAAATAIGKRLMTEFDEIRKASKKKA